MRTKRLMALLAFAVLLPACTPDETGLVGTGLPGAKPTASPDGMGGGVGDGATPTPPPSTGPTPTPTPAPVLQSLAIHPATFTLSSAPTANFDQRAILLGLIGTLSDGRATSPTANWSATPTGRVSISSAGYVQALPGAPGGQVVITASTGSLSAQAVAIITSATLGVSHVELMPLTLALYKPAANGTNLPEYPTKAQLYPTVVMSDLSTTSAVTWFVNDPSVATVSASGLVTALGSGSCTLEARAASDPTKKATCQLSVAAKGAVSVTLE